MKLNEISSVLVESVTDTSELWDLKELEGKKLNWEKAVKFVSKLPNIESNVPNGSVLEVKKGVKFNMTKLIKLLNAMDPSISAYKWPGSTRKFHLDFNFGHPVKSKVLLPSVDITPIKDDEKKREAAEKTRSDMITDLVAKERAKTSDKGGAGWYLTHNIGSAFSSVLGQFEEGPSKGSYFSVQYVPGEKLKVGDTIYVKHEPTYGKVSRVK